jgi:hypothetical protein
MPNDEKTAAAFPFFGLLSFIINSSFDNRISSFVGSSNPSARHSISS